MILKITRTLMLLLVQGLLVDPALAKSLALSLRESTTAQEKQLAIFNVAAFAPLELSFPKRGFLETWRDRFTFARIGVTLAGLRAQPVTGAPSRYYGDGITDSPKTNLALRLAQSERATREEFKLRPGENILYDKPRIIRDDIPPDLELDHVGIPQGRYFRDFRCQRVTWGTWESDAPPEPRMIAMVREKDSNLGYVVEFTLDPNSGPDRFSVKYRNPQVLAMTDDSRAGDGQKPFFADVMGKMVDRHLPGKPLHGDSIGAYSPDGNSVAYIIEVGAIPGHTEYGMGTHSYWVDGHPEHIVLVQHRDPMTGFFHPPQVAGTDMRTGFGKVEYGPQGPIENRPAIKFDGTWLKVASKGMNLGGILERVPGLPQDLAQPLPKESPRLAEMIASFLEANAMSGYIKSDHATLYLEGGSYRGEGPMGEYVARLVNEMVGSLAIRGQLRANLPKILHLREVAQLRTRFAFDRHPVWDRERKRTVDEVNWQTHHDLDPLAFAVDGEEALVLLPSGDKTGNSFQVLVALASRAASEIPSDFEVNELQKVLHELAHIFARPPKAEEVSSVQSERIYGFLYKLTAPIRWIAVVFFSSEPLALTWAEQEAQDRERLLDNLAKEVADKGRSEAFAEAHSVLAIFFHAVTEKTSLSRWAHRFGDVPDLFYRLTGMVTDDSVSWSDFDATILKLFKAKEWGRTDVERMIRQLKSELRNVSDDEALQLVSQYITSTAGARFTPMLRFLWNRPLNRMRRLRSFVKRLSAAG